MFDLRTRSWICQWFAAIEHVYLLHEVLCVVLLKFAQKGFFQNLRLRKRDVLQFLGTTEETFRLQMTTNKTSYTGEYERGVLTFSVSFFSGMLAVL